jgi:hypothetical protein
LPSLWLTQADPFALTYPMSGISLGQPYPFDDEHRQVPFGTCAKRGLHGRDLLLKGSLSSGHCAVDNNAF